MNKLTNEEIARVFSMYYFAECITVKYKEKGFVKHIGKIPNDANYYNLILTPLSSITDEHAIEVAKCCGFNNISWSDKRKRSIGKEIVYAISDNVSISYEVYAFEITYVFQYLIQQGYAVPPFFGIGHPCNGKTAIELGIAESK